MRSNIVTTFLPPYFPTNPLQPSPTLSRGLEGVGEVVLFFFQPTLSTPSLGMEGVGEVELSFSNPLKEKEGAEG